ncbi:MAG: Sarcosine dehydrogenase, partial [uncultured Rubellimicrobium sp.]
CCWSVTSSPRARPGTPRASCRSSTWATRRPTSTSTPSTSISR